MKNLWFVRLEHLTLDSPIVFCFTLPDGRPDAEDEARARAVTFINPDYVLNFRVTRCETICTTPNEVECFEPC